MRLIYYSPHPTHDLVSEVGYSTHQRETINALKDLGVEVLPVVMGGSQVSELQYTEGKAIEHNGLKYYIKKVTPRFIWVSIKDFFLLQHDKKAGRILNQAILDFKADIVYERSEYLQDSGVKPVKSHKIKYFIEVNAPFVEEMIAMEGRSIWISLAHKKEKKKYKNADKIFVVSSALKDFILKRYKIDPDKIIISPNRINPDLFLKNTISEKPNNLIDFKDSTVIGFVGSILPHHYVDVLIEAFNKVIKLDKKASLLIIGEGALLNQLKSMVNQYGLNDQVFFIGKVPHHQVHNYINQMDVCVMPGSNWYGSPIKIFEYAVLGKAIVAPDNSPLRDVMVNGEDGILVETNAEKLAIAFIDLIDSAELRATLGNKFKTKVLADYTWKSAAKMIINAVENHL
jgi:glycosyltransferase involved in cell wall biosynthesis